MLPKLALVIYKINEFSLKKRDLPTLGYTHFQPAQLITLGKRASRWVQDLIELFHGDGGKVDRLNETICEKFGFLATQTRIVPKVPGITSPALTIIPSSLRLNEQQGRYFNFFYQEIAVEITGLTAHLYAHGLYLKLVKRSLSFGTPLSL